MADIRVQGSEERIQSRIAIVLIGQIVLRRGVEMIRQAFDFLDIEDTIGLQERDLFSDGLALVGLCVALDATGKDGLGGFRALADIAAQGLRLFEGDPDRRFKAAYHGFAPE